MKEQSGIIDAAERKYTAMMLAAKNALDNLVKLRAKLDTAGELKYTALMMAAERGDADAIELLQS